MPHRAILWKSLTSPTIIEEKGGSGSGNFGHGGRPGKRGGSAGGTPASGSGARRIETEEGAKAFLASPGLNPEISDEQATHLEDYKSEDYAYINDAMRNDWAEEYEGEIESIEKAINSGSGLPESVVVYRGVHEDAFWGANGVPEDLTGIEFKDKAFVSTSLNVEVGDRFAVKAGEGGITMEIRLPKGSKALNMERWGAGTEGELLLQKDTTFKIISDNRASGRAAESMGTIQVEVVP